MQFILEIRERIAQMTDAVIFDMDGLMFGTEQLTHELWDQLGEELGYRNVSAIMPETMGVRLKESEPIFKRRFGHDFPFTAFVAEYRRRFAQKIQTHGVPVKEGLYDLLEYLRREHFVCAIASSTSREKVLEYCGKTNVTQYFQTILCGDMVERCKPDPQIYLTTARELGTAPERCMVLEDSPNGCLSAIRAGMKTIMIPDQVQPTEELRAKLTACVPTLRDVIPLLKAEREAQP
jgi:HAD superfamily hydrolase (TIGR01509 family)